MQAVPSRSSVSKGMKYVGNTSVCRGMTLRTLERKPRPDLNEKDKNRNSQNFPKKPFVDETCVDILHGLRFVQVYVRFDHFRRLYKDNDVNNIIALTILLRHCTCSSYLYDTIVVCVRRFSAKREINFPNQLKMKMS